MAWVDIQSYNNLEHFVFELRWIENVMVTLFFEIEFALRSLQPSTPILSDK